MTIEIPLNYVAILMLIGLMFYVVHVVIKEGRP